MSGWEIAVKVWQTCALVAVLCLFAIHLMPLDAFDKCQKTAWAVLLTFNLSMIVLIGGIFVLVWK